MWLERTIEIVDWICIVMFILGTLGNSLGLIVFCSRKFRGTTYGRLAIASLIINLLCVVRYSCLLHSTTRQWITYQVAQSWFNCKLYRFSSCLRILSSFVLVTWTYERFTYVTSHLNLFTNHPVIRRYKFYLIGVLSLIIIGSLTGPTVYFYEIQQFIDPRTDQRSTNASTKKNEDLTLRRTICALKESTSSFWRTFLTDVIFGWNYTTLRSIFSEMIPSILVILFDTGIVIHVIQSRLTIASNGPSASSRASFQSKEGGTDGLMVHNRPRTSWMNLVLIIHSCLFCFSSLTASIVHWSTSNALLSHWTSVVILANCSLNFYVYCLSGQSFRQEIRKLFDRYFQIYCFGKCFNLCRTKEQREEVAQTVHMRLVRHRSTIIPAQCLAHLRQSAFTSNQY